jgi:hypothetical protein
MRKGAASYKPINDYRADWKIEEGFIREKTPLSNEFIAYVNKGFDIHDKL